MLHIANNGPLIVSTNYWETDLAHDGKVYLSVNASCFRMLLPDALKGELADMRAAREAIISRGPWPNAGRRDAIEVLLDDSSRTPYALLLSIEQVGRLPLDSDAGRPFTFAIYTRGPFLRFSCTAHYRLA